MSCPENPVTLLWLYGEGPDEHAAHVAECAHCASVVEAHEEVMAVVVPVLSGAVAQDRSPARRRWPVFGALVLLAAGLALTLMPRPVSTTTTAPEVLVVLDASPSSLWSDDFTDDLSDLELAVDVLAAELSGPQL